MDTLEKTDTYIDQLLKQYDEVVMPTPTMDQEPHLLISRVRKQYMEYIIKLLALNYETNHRLLNKNIYMPSAIWRCAKKIEMEAARDSMVVQLYRKNIISVIKDLKNNTKRGTLYKKLSECLCKPLQNDKIIQTNFSKSDECICQPKKRRKTVDSNTQFSNDVLISKCSNDNNPHDKKILADNSEANSHSINKNESQTDILLDSIKLNNNSSTTDFKMSIEMPDSDELMVQLEKLFQGDTNDDDIFEDTFCATVQAVGSSAKVVQDDELKVQNLIKKQDAIVENHSAQIKSLDERLASLSGLLTSQQEENVAKKTKPENIKRKKNSTKFLCDEHFLKQRLFERLDKMRETDREKHARVKQKSTELFGIDSDEEGILSPLEETPRFVLSCKERIAPWVVKLLTPNYRKGRIKDKALFKALAKHLIGIIYKCSRYPHKREVKSFVYDFLANHKIIMCEEDFKEFRINNI